MHRKTLIICIVVISIITIASTLVLLQPEHNDDNDILLPPLIQSLFADDGDITSSGGSFCLSDIYLNDNLTIIEIGEVNYTSVNDLDGFGFEIDWTTSFNEIWITVELLFTVPDGIDINDYAANITFFVDTFHNSSFFWQFDIPSIPLEETQTGFPDYWRNGTSSGNETIIVNTTAQKSDKFEIAVTDGKIHAQFAMVMTPYTDDFSRILITFGKIDIWEL